MINSAMVTSVIHHVQLAMPPGQEATAREFYEGVLGLTEVAKPAMLAARGGAWFRADGIELHLGVEEDFRPAAKAHPGLLVDDIDERAARLERNGSPVRWDADFPRMRRFYTADPFGNRLELLQPL